MESVDVWTYRDQVQLGFDRQAARKSRDTTSRPSTARIGKVDSAATSQVRGSYVIVDTGPWIFGKKVMLPAGVIQRVDEADEKVWVNRTKDQIKAAPEYDDSKNTDPDYRSDLGSYYGSGGQGFRDWD